MDGHIVSMALHPNLKPFCVKDASNACQRRLSILQQFGCSAIKESHFAQTHNEAFRGGMHFDFMSLDLVSQRFFELSFQLVNVHTLTTCFAASWCRCQLR